LDTFVSFFSSPFWRPSWNSPLPATFLTLKMISVDSLTPETQVKTPNLSLQYRSRWSYIGYKGAAAILDAILNYTSLPHIWNVYPSFFNLLWAPYKDQKSKFGDISLHTGPPLSPRTSLIMNLDRLSERARRPFWRPSWNSPLPATFLTLKMISMDSSTPKAR